MARLMEDPEEKNRTEAFLQEYREKRGPSLMDAHLDKLGKRPKTVDTRLKSFDHEKVCICPLDDVILYSEIMWLLLLGNGRASQNEHKGCTRHGSDIQRIRFPVR